MKFNQLVSVVINNFNYERFIGEAIRSVLAQDHDLIEVIVVDDGSTDNSRSVIDSFDDPRIVRVYKENGGQASALNAGFAKARGRYVAFLDSDDLFDYDKLTRVLDVFERNDCAAVQHQLRVIDGEGEMSDRLFPPLKFGNVDVLPLYFEHRDTAFYSATSGIVASRRILRRIFPLPEHEWRICADVPLTRPLAVFGNIYTMKEAAGSYRIHETNNWMGSDQRAVGADKIRGKANQFTNQFLRRWGINEQIVSSVPIDVMAERGVEVVALYGAGRHTRNLLESQEVPEADFRVVIDDRPATQSIAGVPVITCEAYEKQNSCDAVLISSDAYELEMVRKALGRGWQKLIPIYSLEQFKKQKVTEINALVRQLRIHRKRRIALYGAGVHSLNLILSGLVPKGIEITCLLDEKPSGTALWGVPIYHPEKVDRTLFDAVIISSDVYERPMFYQARDFGLESIFIISGATLSLKHNRADYEDIRAALSGDEVQRIALYDDSWFTQCLLQSGYLDGIEIKGVLVETRRLVDTFYGYPVACIDAQSIPEFDILIVPPRVPPKVVDRLKQRFGTRVFTFLENPDEIALIYDFFTMHTEGKVMLDVGANVGMSLLPFAQDGWQVHAFEPDSLHRKRLEACTADFPSVSICDRALSDRIEKNVPLYRSQVSGGISGLSVFHKSHYLSEYIETMLLSDYVREQGIVEADFLKIDTEGYDLFVLKGNDWSKFRPRLIMCEYEDHKTVPLGYDFYSLANFFQEKGYHLLVSEWSPVIEYGNQPRWKRFVQFPCTLLDPDGFGNILAFRELSDAEQFKECHGIKA